MIDCCFPPFSRKVLFPLFLEEKTLTTYKNFCPGEETFLCSSLQKCVRSVHLEPMKSPGNFPLKYLTETLQAFGQRNLWPKGLCFRLWSEKIFSGNFVFVSEISHLSLTKGLHLRPLSDQRPYVKALDRR